MFDDLQAKAGSTGITVVPFALKSPNDLDDMFDAIAAQRVDALQIISDPRTRPVTWAVESLRSL